MSKKLISLFLSFNLLLVQSGFAQGVAELNLGQYLGQMGASLKPERFRPPHLRYFSYDIANDNFQLLLDKGDNQDIKEAELQEKTKVLMEYFQIGLALPNDKFWVNLRPDAQDQIIDPELEKTDLGKVMLEADLQLKKDTAQFTSPQSPEGRLYWDKLYQKARELFGSEPANIPTITRPWIVPGEIIVREGETSAYIFKANLKVMLEEDYLSSQPSALSSQQYNFKDPRMKELNTYSTQLIRELIIPKLTKEVNTAKRYAALRQVFFSLVLARWFKERFVSQRTEEHLPAGRQGEQRTEKANLVRLIDSRDLTNLTSKSPWSKSFYFNEYNKSFEKGEYNLKEQIATPSGQVIRSYVSGGIFGIMEGPSGYEVNRTSGSPLKVGDLLVMFMNKLPGVSILFGNPLALSTWPRDELMRLFMPDNEATDIVNEFKESIKKIFDENTYTKIALKEKEAFLNRFKSKYKDPEEALTDINAAYEWLKTGSIIFRPWWLTITTISKEEKQKMAQKRAPIEGAFSKAEEQLVKALYGSSPLTPSEEKSVEHFKKEVGKAIEDYQQEFEALWTKAKEEEDPLFVEVYLGFLVNITKVVNEMMTLYEEKKESILTLQDLNNFIDELMNKNTVLDQTIEELAENLKIWITAALETFSTATADKVNDHYDKVVKIDDNFVGAICKILILSLDEEKKTASKEREIEIENMKREILLSLKVEDPDSSASPLNRELGGIDFRTMQMLIQPMGSFSNLNLSLPTLSSSALERIDLDKELAALRNMVKAGMVPSGARVKEYLAAVFQKGRMEEKQDDLLLCLAEIYRLQEEEVLETSPELRESLVIVDTGKFVLLPTNQKVGLN